MATRRSLATRIDSTAGTASFNGTGGRVRAGGDAFAAVGSAVSIIVAAVGDAGCGAGGFGCDGGGASICRADCAGPAGVVSRTGRVAGGTTGCAAVCDGAGFGFAGFAIAGFSVAAGFSDAGFSVAGFWSNGFSIDGGVVVDFTGAALSFVDLSGAGFSIGTGSFCASTGGLSMAGLSIDGFWTDAALPG